MKFVQCIDVFVQTKYNINKKGRDSMAKSNTSNISIRMDSNLKLLADSSSVPGGGLIERAGKWFYNNKQGILEQHGNRRKAKWIILKNGEV